MKFVISICLLSFALVGCSHDSSIDQASLPSGAGKALNPSGKPQTPQQQQLQQQMQQSGQRAAQSMAAAAAAEREAKQRTGGK